MSKQYTLQRITNRSIKTLSSVDFVGICASSNGARIDFNGAEAFTVDIPAAELQSVIQRLTTIRESLVRSAAGNDDRFVPPCSCRPVMTGPIIKIGSEDDCPVHGLEAPL